MKVTEWVICDGCERTLERDKAWTTTAIGMFDGSTEVYFNCDECHRKAVAALKDFLDEYE
jgi:hypothetical protein